MVWRLRLAGSKGSRVALRGHAGGPRCTASLSDCGIASATSA